MTRPAITLAAAASLLALAACDLPSTAPPSGGQTTDDALIDRGNRSYVASPEGLDVTNRLPICFVRGQTDNLEVTESPGRNVIVSGEARVPRNALADRSFERARRVENLAPEPGVVHVMVNVSRGAGGSPFAALLDGAAASPVIIDTQGTRYQPAGFAYLDREWGHVRYDPASPIERVADLPPTSPSRPDQFCWLVYRVSFGRSIARLESDNGRKFDLATPVVLNVTPGG